MPTFVTRIRVTQVDSYEPRENELIAPGSQVWVIEWSKTAGPLRELRTTEVSLDGARRTTMNLLKQRPPDLSVEDVLTLVGFDGAAPAPESEAGAADTTVERESGGR